MMMISRLEKKDAVIFWLKCLKTLLQEFGKVQFKLLRGE